MSATIVYSSFSTPAPLNFRGIDFELYLKEERAFYASLPAHELEDEAHCFVCGRHTDHWGEHDDLVDQGVARYSSDGSVYWV